MRRGQLWFLGMMMAGRETAAGRRRRRRRLYFARSRTGEAGGVRDLRVRLGTGSREVVQVDHPLRRWWRRETGGALGSHRMSLFVEV